MRLWDTIIRLSAWSSGPTEADIARSLLRCEPCPLCVRHDRFEDETCSVPVDFGRP